MLNRDHIVPAGEFAGSFCFGPQMETGRMMSGPLAGAKMNIARQCGGDTSVQFGKSNGLAAT
jgi:hypothetical protein